ncbi:MAG: hypothetical protein B7Y36_11160 [Novosphingobium sp. 28-62-57]|uniref:hypothetical protein n=1 Tax=unclassified Novosphingobium TaxID=2644732 RepID=UPI000BC834D1|nr:MULTISPECIES: hypothetical protein [unclassified Novosphingobium]OYW50921.1 MAG: hypothetical protein B7Z34_03675 [Novosphingobium sp. 12-62-10]OYZ09941.1 MAG: hypothetical protein B7Y36_11160 [Novosphingobium sp. 28-62-57]OZA36555.1 MAG: hypothetical protein B7X92_06080 [Novosphingobium sp. 17-62-9]HQS69994.1 hypothetical protein [Novosphingobium sp.]
MRTWKFGLAITAMLLLAGCLLLPGKFTSAIDLRKDGAFSFTYKGDIHVLALSKVAASERARTSADAKFEPSPCYSPNSGDEQECSAEELAEQKKAWEEDIEASKVASAEKRKSDEQMMKTMLGGIDPTDPRAAQEFADRLRRQKGWKSVVDKGDGRFEVEYAIAGRLDHDFSFPTVEKLPMVTPFITMMRRADGGVRIDAPAFASAPAGAPFMGMAAAMADGKNQKAGADGMPVLDGVLTLTTDGDILANNTDDGPVASTTGKMLKWQVNARANDAPTALIRIAP